MNNKPAERTQVDELQDEYSDLAGLDFTDSRDMARHEFKEETDINATLKKFGVMQQHPYQYGNEVDNDLDLHTAFLAVAQAKEAHSRLPQHLREKYDTWRDLLNAVERGELNDLNEPTPTPEEPQDGTAAAGTGTA